MKKIAFINSVCNGSTGKIMGEIQREANSNGFETVSFYGRGNGFSDVKCIKMNKNNSFYFNIFHTFVFNKQGQQSKNETRYLIKKLQEFNPDIIHLHNIHGYYLNYKILFNWINKSFKGKVVWTLHDCWSFTGHCAHFVGVNCQKWKSQCAKKCPLRHSYPYSFFVDTSESEYNLKKDLFTYREDFEIVTPSDWLNKLVNQSFLKKHHVLTINNGINLEVFKPSINKEIKQKYGVPDQKKIILGVSNVWVKSKGFYDFLRLSNELLGGDIVIILVGLSKAKLNKVKQSKNIVGIERTENVNELVAIYSLADVFVNLTKEDNYPTVNMESIACGTPVITYDTGGCIEQVDSNTGYCCKTNTVEEVKEKILEFLECDFKNTKFNNCKMLNEIDAKKRFNDYIKLFEKITE